MTSNSGPDHKPGARRNRGRGPANRPPAPRGSRVPVLRSALTCLAGSSERFRAELEDRLRWERVSLGKEHSEAVRGIESKAGEFYREGLEGSEKRAREAARSNGLLLSYGSRPVDWYRINELKHSVSEERLEQVREIDGEQAYEKMRRAVEKASQEKARQVERARLEWDRQETARQSRDRRGPERGGRSGTLAPAASLVLLRGSGRMGRTDWEEA